jgi:hypothetical protein
MLVSICRPVMHAQYYSFANDIVKACELSLNNMVADMGATSIDVTSFAVSNNLTWPYVTLPDWEIRSRQSRSIAGVESMAFIPIVSPDDKVQWEKYAAQNTDWLYQGLGVQGRSPSANDSKISKNIYYAYDEGTHLPFHLPIHEFGPAPDQLSSINLDFGSFMTFQRAVPAAIRGRKATLSEITSVVGLYITTYSWYDGNIMSAYTPSAPTDAYAIHSSVSDMYDSTGNISFPTWSNTPVPHTYIMQPIFDTFSSDAEVVGFVMGIFPWIHLFLHLLPEGVNGLIIVVEDSCGEQITCKIEGEHATFMGYGDMHDPVFDDYRVAHSFDNFTAVDNLKYDNEEKIWGNGSSTCAYILSVYPTSQFRAKYITDTPKGFSFAVVCIIFMTAMVFVLYDVFVSRRQRAVVSAATRTQALVSSLFPTSVQDRILDDAAKSTQKDSAFGSAYTARAKAQLRDFFQGGGDNDEQSSPLLKSRPIADLFPVSSSLI